MIVRLCLGAAAAILIGTVLVRPGSSGQAADPAPVPVMLQSRDDLDPCAVGRVTGLKPVAGNTLSVRTGPGRAYPERDRLPPGRTVLLCDSRPGWRGIIYGVADEDACALPADLKQPRPYQGDCRAGWVAQQYMEVIAD
jgi:hypothetical protein